MPGERSSPSGGWREVYDAMNVDPAAEEPQPCRVCGRPSSRHLDGPYCRWHHPDRERGRDGADADGRDDGADADGDDDSSGNRSRRSGAIRDGRDDHDRAGAATRTGRDGVHGDGLAQFATDGG